ncbi:nicotinate (nicotinamide) nucleotide adenylyltransferase [Flavilitoribacter nigricans]|uniref:Probable nicotinate-nucleotide adenylyltransferase n=1 Tax=Flavilitoribacter nigricans (strain ATCC 23147 / DSM 23189 / NBRC 102662 / NCIMB 1420 / SS-2) TaxID=1122177 RepID=A0A2D0N6Q7_FLAN2|nr:nicotinate (nicotinamide) nucleotide adenylyltransferase [Flavilitoribacter nigricans]PHN04222.1 nicotinic acid mononucleotide adenylyltransferase [Flavilitoribacter nigricans DSM 23189 = NBRC 102662]
MAGAAIKKKIGLFFGSFNPVHVGHMIIANYMATQTDLDQVWLVVSPQNPLKPKNSLARDYDRLHLVRLAIGENPNLRASDIEFSLPKPSYTIDTLTYLKEKYPDHQFVLIMGGDNLASLHRWKNYELLLRDHEIFVYRRPGYDIPQHFEEHPQVHFFEAPLMHISASYIRQAIQEGHSVQYLVTEPVFQYLESSALYKS